MRIIFGFLAIGVEVSWLISFLAKYLDLKHGDKIIEDHKELSFRLKHDVFKFV